jgi:hypothetical protein
MFMGFLRFRVEWDKIYRSPGMAELRNGPGPLAQQQANNGRSLYQLFGRYRCIYLHNGRFLNLICGRY